MKLVVFACVDDHASGFEGVITNGCAAPQPPPPPPPSPRPLDRLVGLVVKASASRAEDPGFESRVRRDFSGVESYQ